MSKESMLRITSPEARAKRKANPWTLDRRAEFLHKQTNDDVYKKRQIFDRINQAKEAEDAADTLAAHEESSQKQAKQDEYAKLNNLPF